MVGLLEYFGYFVVEHLREERGRITRRSTRMKGLGMDILIGFRMRY